MKKILVAPMLLSSFLVAQDIQFQSGWNFVSIVENVEYKLTDLISDLGSNVEDIVGFDGTRTLLSSSIPTLIPTHAYWIKVNGTPTISVSGNNSSPYMSAGWNAVGFSSTETLSNWITTMSNSGYTVQDIVGFNGTQTVLSSGISNVTSGNGYWVNVSSIDLNTFIPNTLPNEATDLANIDEQTDLDNHSMITAANVSSELKFYLTSVDNERYFKKVEIPNFSASTLNGSDSDINSTVTSAVSSITSGTCGQIVLGSTDNMTISVVDNSGVVTSSLATTYNGSDGNFTIGTDYEKVVWYGDAISLDSVTDCQITSELLPPNGGKPPS